MLHKLVKFGSWGQWIVALAGGLCSMTAGQAGTWPAPALPLLRDGSAGVTLTRDEESWMVAIVFLTDILSPIPAGYVMDWIGRKNSLLITNLFGILSWILIFYAYTPVPIFVARALIGIWAGFVYTVVPVYMSETFEAGVRGSMGALFGLTLYVGGLYEALVGMWVGYRELALFSLLPSVLLFFILLVLPESAYFHLAKENRSEAANTIRWLRGTCDEVQLDAIHSSVRNQLANRGSFIEIFTVRQNRKAFIIAESLTAFRSMAGFALLISYATVTIPESFVSSRESFILLLIMWIFGSLLSILLLDKLGRRPVLMISSLGSCLTMTAVTVWYYFRDKTDWTGSQATSWFPLAGLLANGLFFSAGLISIPLLIQGEIFPVNIRGKASALASISIALSSGISVKIYQPITDNIGIYANFLICALASACAMVFAYTHMIETKGKTLEEIQDILLHDSQKKCTNGKR